MLQILPILRLIICFRGFFVGLRAGVDEETGGYSKSGPGRWAMRPEASVGPTRLTVRRQFEPNRLAVDCQSLAYEQVVPVNGQVELAARTLEHVDDGQRVQANLTQEGVAA